MGEMLTSFHSKDRRKSFFGVIQRPIAIVENADAIPKFGILLDKGEKLAGCKRGNFTLGFGNRYRACWYAEYAFCRSSCMR